MYNCNFVVPLEAKESICVSEWLLDRSGYVLEDVGEYDQELASYLPFLEDGQVLKLGRSFDAYGGRPGRLTN